MEGLLDVVLCVLLFFSFSKAEHNASHQNQPTNNLVVQNSLMPDAAPLTYLFLREKNVFLCGGAMIHIRHILAPASCIPDNVHLFDYYVKLGMATRNFQFGVPKQREALQDSNINIAIFLLEQEILVTDYVMPIWLPNYFPEPHTPVTQIGWNLRWMVKAKMVEITSINHEIHINFSPTYECNNVKQMGRYLVRHGSILGMATLYNSSQTHLDYINLENHRQFIIDTINRNIAENS